MEKRISKRQPVELEAEIISGGERYEVCIENISENGVGIECSIKETEIYFEPGATIELKLHLPSGEILNLNCDVKWYTRVKNVFQEITIRVGLQIIDPPLEYRKFYEELFSGGLS